MKNMNAKTKKWLAVTGCLALCAVLVVLIGQQFITPKPVDTPPSPQSSEVSNVTVDPRMPDSTEKEKESTVSSMICCLLSATLRTGKRIF